MGNRRLIVFSMAMFILLPFAVVPYAHAKGLHCGLGDIRCLISAIKTANESGQPMRVSLAAGTYTLSAHDLLPSVTGNVTIVGASPVATVLDASGVFVFLGAVITVESNGTLTLQNLTVRGGDTGIVNQGTSALLNTEVRDNLGAGGIFNLGTMTIVNSEIHDNFARLAPAGGIFNGSGTLTIVRSTIERNEGVEGTGGIENRGGMLSISDSMISENFGQFTGGVSNFSGELTIADSTFFNNTGGVVSAIDAGAVARISRTSIVGNRVGFGVFLGGSAIVGGNETSIENTTIVGNVANLPLGACCAVVGGVLINSTIADNVGTAGQVAFATLQNTIVDRTGFTAGVGPDCRSGITSLGNNIIGDPSGCVDALQASDRTGSAGLASGSNAFVTGIVPLLSTSQAIDAANPTACPSLDQRRLPRVDGNGDGIVQCDVGAVEFVHHVVDIRVEPHVFSAVANRAVTVDVFGDSEFDPETIDLTTVLAGATGYETSSRGTPRFADVDEDGIFDLRLNFTASAFGIGCETPFVAFTAKTVNGESVAGVSEVVLRNCRR